MTSNGDLDIHMHTLYDLLRRVDKADKETRKLVAKWVIEEAHLFWCSNCQGRKCMDCVLRYEHRDCEHDCPDCCYEPDSPENVKGGWITGPPAFEGRAASCKRLLC